mmetsp:Transcript_68433/g.135219  ORF Transcript_68433/g.135219 Transcript_68433/m.135219 type:complete len:82 (-) Transcript_68433:1718-1963(-)
MEKVNQQRVPVHCCQYLIVVVPPVLAREKLLAMRRGSHRVPDSVSQLQMDIGAKPQPAAVKRSSTASETQTQFEMVRCLAW